MIDLGGIYISIQGDTSKLEADIARAQSLAKSAGTDIAASFTTAASNASKLADSVNQVTAATQRLSEAETQAGTSSRAGSEIAIEGIQEQESELLKLFDIEFDAASGANTLANSAAGAGAALAGMGGAAGGAVPPLQAVGAAAGGAASPLNQTAAASGNAMGSMFRLYSVLSLVRRGLDDLDKFRQSEEELTHLADATGVAAQRLAQFQGAIGLAGGNEEQFGQTLNRLARAMETADQGSAKMQDDLKRLGVTTKDPIEAFFQIADTVHDTKDRFEALGTASQVLGRSSVDLVGIFAQGSAALRQNAAASLELAQARVGATQSAHEMTVAEVQLKQALATVTAEAFPALLEVLKTVAIDFEAALYPLKLFFTALIDGSILGVHAFESLGQSMVAFAEGDLGKAVTSLALAKDGVSDLNQEFKHLFSDLKKDGTDTLAFMNKLEHGTGAASTPGAGKPFPKPAPTSGTNLAALEDQAEVAHNHALLEMARTREQTLIDIQKGSDLAQIESIENKHKRAIAIAAEELAAAEARRAAFKRINDQELQDNTAVLKKKLADTAGDKKAPAEAIRIRQQIQAEQDKHDERELQETENVEKAKAHLTDTTVTQTRQSKVELDELVRESQQLLDRNTAQLEQATTRLSEIRAQANIRVEETQAKGTGQVEQLQIQAQKLQLERQYGLEIGHTLNQEIQHETAIAELDSKGRAAKIAGLQAELQIAAQGEKEAAARSSKALFVGDTREAEKAGQDEVRDKVKVAEIQQQINDLRAQANNADIEAQIKLDQLRRLRDLRKSVGQDVFNAGQQVPGALGAGLARGIIDGKSIGRDIKQELKGIGQELLGRVLQHVIQELIVKLGIEAAAQAALGFIFGTTATAQAVATTANTVAVVASTVADTGLIVSNVGLTAALVANTAAVTANTAVSAIPFLAGGGTLDARQPAIVGEKGPELWVPDQAGTIIPAGKFTVTMPPQKFAEGGRPPVGIQSLFGEKGPELFIPDQARISPGAGKLNITLPEGKALPSTNASMSHSDTLASANSSDTVHTVHASDTLTTHFGSSNEGAKRVAANADAQSVQRFPALRPIESTAARTIGQRIASLATAGTQGLPGLTGVSGTQGLSGASGLSPNINLSLPDLGLPNSDATLSRSPAPPQRIVTESDGTTIHLHGAQFHGVQNVRELMREISQYAKTQSPKFSQYAR